MSENLVPKLRFNDFDDVWEIKKLKDIIQISKEKYNPANTKTNYKCIELEHLSSETGILLGYTDSLNQNSIKNVFHDENILFGKLRPYLKKFYFSTFDGVCSSEIWVFNTQEHPKFIYYLIQTKKFLDIANVSSGSKMPRSDWNFMKDRNFSIPNIKTQKKIANFISAIDKKIELLEHKHQHYQEFKKYLMQQIFAQKLRFDNQEWEIKKIGDIFDERSEKGFDDLELLSVTINKGVIKRSEIEDKDNSSDNKSNYKHVLPGDIVYNSMRMWQGASGVSDFEGIVSPAYTILTPSVELNPKFFGYYFKTHKMLHQFTKYSQGLTSDTWNLKYPLISEISIKIPSVNEQNKFTNFLSPVDKKISTIQKEIDQVENFKKGLLQQMFI